MCRIEGMGYLRPAVAVPSRYLAAASRPFAARSFCVGPRGAAPPASERFDGGLFPGVPVATSACERRVERRAPLPGLLNSDMSGARYVGAQELIDLDL